MQYTSNISWQRNNVPFSAKTYDRTHQIAFGGGSALQGSSAPEFLGNATLVNPEELFTASIASCFMLTFLYWAAMKNIVIDEYTAKAVGTLAKNAEGKMAMTEVSILPQIKFGEGMSPTSDVLEELFKKAHEQCFISSSVKTAVKVQYAGVAV